MATQSKLQSLRTETKQANSDEYEALSLRVNLSARLGAKNHAIYLPFQDLSLEELQECMMDAMSGNLEGVRAWCDIARSRYQHN